MSAGHKPSWVVDPSRFATKIRSASSFSETGKEEFQSNPTKSCPRCHYVIDNTDVAHEWPGLPRGVKFDPSDPEIIWHLLAKVGVGSYKLHPFINEFIPTVDEDDGICYTHPQNLPGVKQDGSVAHFFHRAIKAYNTGTRKRRKILGDDRGDVRWHKTGRTKPVLLDGVQKGCKKIMVLYVSTMRGGKAEKTNWVMHQYHLGTGEDEMEGEYVISKVFYQQQQVKQSEKTEDVPGIPDATMIPKVDPVTPKLVAPEPRIERKVSNIEPPQDSTLPIVQQTDEVYVSREVETPSGCNDLDIESTQRSTVPNPQLNGLYMLREVETPSVDTPSECDDLDENNLENLAIGLENKNDDEDELVDEKWEDYLLSSQQLMEAISFCGDLLQSQSQSPGRAEHGNGQELKKPPLSDYAHLRTEDFKRDIEECKNMVDADPAADLPDVEMDTPVRLSQIDFESQDSYVAWGGSTDVGKIVESQDSWTSLP